MQNKNCWIVHKNEPTKLQMCVFLKKSSSKKEWHKAKINFSCQIFTWWKKLIRCSGGCKWFMQGAAIALLPMQHSMRQQPCGPLCKQPGCQSKKQPMIWHPYVSSVIDINLKIYLAHFKSAKCQWNSTDSCRNIEHQNQSSEEQKHQCSFYQMEWTIFIFSKKFGSTSKRRICIPVNTFTKLLHDFSAHSKVLIFLLFTQMHLSKTLKLYQKNRLKNEIFECQKHLKQSAWNECSTPVQKNSIITSKKHFIWHKVKYQNLKQWKHTWNKYLKANCTRYVNQIKTVQKHQMSFHRVSHMNGAKLHMPKKQ